MKFIVECVDAFFQAQIIHQFSPRQRCVLRGCGYFPYKFYGMRKGVLSFLISFFARLKSVAIYVVAPSPPPASMCFRMKWNEHIMMCAMTYDEHVGRTMIQCHLWCHARARCTARNTSDVLQLFHIHDEHNSNDLWILRMSHFRIVEKWNIPCLTKNGCVGCVS